MAQVVCLASTNPAGVPVAIPEDVLDLLRRIFGDGNAEVASILSRQPMSREDHLDQALITYLDRQSPEVTLEALFNLAFLSWWLGLVRFPALPDATISPAPFVMQYLYWPLALVFAAGAAVAIVNALAPEWSPRRALARLCVDLLGIAVLLAVVAAWPFVRVAGHGAEIGMLVINWSLAITIGLVVLSLAVRAVLDIQRVRGQAAPDNWLVFALAGE